MIETAKYGFMLLEYGDLVDGVAITENFKLLEEMSYTKTEVDSGLALALTKVNNEFITVNDMIKTKANVTDTYTKTQVDKRLEVILGNDGELDDNVFTLLGDKVDKELGKQLTTNDYSNAEKEKVRKLTIGDVTGPIGLTGPRGATGLTGARGIPGANGKDGIDGDTITGPRGFKGDTGADGSDGARGIQGPIGIKGVQGDTGPRGWSGSDGAKGDKGDRGYTGTAGSRGIQGPKGTTGDRGIQGPRGVSGSNGSKGDKGDRGPIGTTGSRGLTGARGLRGLEGPVGSDATVNKQTVLQAIGYEPAPHYRLTNIEHRLAQLERYH